MNFKAIVPKTVAKQIFILPDTVQERILEGISRLEKNPRPSGSKKLKSRNLWRLRVGDYRIVYEIHDMILIILVVTVAHRKDVYR